MSTTPKMFSANNVTGATTVVTVPVGASFIITSMSICNDAGADTTVTVTVNDSSTAVAVKLLNSAPVPNNNVIFPLNQNHRMVLEAGDSLSVTAANAVDVIVSGFQEA